MAIQGLVMGLWPKRLSRYLPGSMAGLVLATVVVGTLGDFRPVPAVVVL